MREINEHMKEVMGIKNQPKPSPNPKNWNWLAIITWVSIGVIFYNIFNFLFNLL